MERTQSRANSVGSLLLGAASAGLAGGLVALAVTLLAYVLWSPTRAASAALQPVRADLGGVVGHVVTFGQSAEEYRFSMVEMGVEVFAVLLAGLAALLAALSGTPGRGLVIGAIGPALISGALLFSFDLPPLRENRWMIALGENCFLAWALTLNVLAGGAAGVVGGLIGRRYCWTSKAPSDTGTIHQGSAALPA